MSNWVHRKDWVRVGARVQPQQLRAAGNKNPRPTSSSRGRPDLVLKLRDLDRIQESDLQGPDPQLDSTLFTLLPVCLARKFCASHKPTVYAYLVETHRLNRKRDRNYLCFNASQLTNDGLCRIIETPQGFTKPTADLRYQSDTQQRARS